VTNIHAIQSVSLL